MPSANSAARSMPWEEFAQMLLLDSGYILHCFGIGGAGAGGRAVDYISIVRDVVYLLENQIPLFVLERVHRLVVLGERPPGPGSSDVEAMKREIQLLLRKQGYSILDVAASARPCHLVHLLRMHFRPTKRAREKKRGGAGGGWDANVHRSRRATQYEVAGVELERRRLDAGEQACSVLDVELRGRALRVPPLTVDGSTWRMLRNLMALEQHSPGVGSHVTAYCLFMSQVASTEADVARLAEKGIIVHLLGSNRDVAEGFVSLCKGVAVDLLDRRRNYLRGTMEKLERLYRSRRYDRMPWHQSRRLCNPWLLIALFACVTVLACQLIQAVCAIKRLIRSM